jgi:NTE family protein
MSDRNMRLVDLGLQGGGAHGAFTWGVLDRLLEEDWLEFDGVSGTSAGAMNAAVFVDGLAAGGREGARAALERFWRKVADAGRTSPMQRGLIERMLGLWTLDYSPVFLALEASARMMSPYDLHAVTGNPLETILAECVDFDRLSQAPTKLFVNATNVRTGRGRIFRNAEVTPEVLLASACLPTMFQAVEIDGEAYWDGGYSGNPSITPLVRECRSHDTILVQINPIRRPEPPRTARDIQNRLNEIAFNSVLIKELRTLALIRDVVDPGTGDGRLVKAMRVHRIASDLMLELGYSSKLLVEWDFFTMLRDNGRKVADEFLGAHGKDIGIRSTLDLDAYLEGI